MPSQFLQNDPNGYFRFADRANATRPGSVPGTRGRQSTAACATRCRDLVSPSPQAVQERLELLLALDVPCEVKVA